MKSWKPRDGLHATLLERAAALGAAALPAALTTAVVPAAAGSLPAPAGAPAPAPAADPLPAPLADWLTQLTLFYGVPFEYLVADARLLPTESLRFFYVDPNWQDRLVDGALSVGINSSADSVLLQQTFEAVYAQVDAGRARLRATLRGVDPPAGMTTGGTWTGFLFRSVVVSTWPGLEVNATAAGVPVPIVRMDLITSDILLCILNGVPDTVELIEPGEGLHFGVDGLPGQSTFEVSLRGLGLPSATQWAAGAQIEDPPGSGTYLKAAGSFRTGTGQPAGVLDVAGLVASVEGAMPAGALGTGGALTPGGFAVQMVRGAGLQSFQTSQPPSPPSVSVPTAHPD